MTAVMDIEKYLAKYLRISEDDGDIGVRKKESDSIANQRKVLDSYIACHEELSNFPVKEFVDDGVSGVTFQRPAVQMLLKEVREGRVACIVVKDLSRFGRNYIEVGDYIEQIFPFLGVRFIAVSDQFDSLRNTAGIDIGFKNLIHELYSRDLSGKVKSAIAVRQKRGCYNGGGIPYGYQLGKEGEPPFIPDGEAADVVKRIFSLAADGNTTSRIADILNQGSVPTPGVYKKQHGGISYSFKNEKQNLWTAAQVNLIIRNQVYRGTYVAHKLSTVRPGVVRKNKEAVYVTLDNHHERLVEEELFQKAQLAIKQRGRSKNRAEYESALKGKVKCGCCGYSMSIRREAKEPYYRCWTGKGCGSYMKMNVKLLEATVWDTLQQLMETCLEQEKKLKNVRAQKLEKVSKAKEEKRLTEIQIENCRVSRLDLYHRWKEGMLTKEEYIKKKDELNQRGAEGQKRLEQLEAYLEDAVLAVGVPEQDKSLSMLMKAENLSQELVDELIEKIEVYSGNRIEIKWKVMDIFA